MNPSNPGTTLAAMAALVLGLVLTVYWVLFPYFVYSKMDAGLKLLRELVAATAKTNAALAALNAKLAQSANPSAPPPLPGEERYFVHMHNETAGPFPVAHIHDSFKRGTIQPDTLLLKEGEKDWRKLEDTFSVN